MKFPRAAGGNEGDPRGRECSAENEGARLEWGGGDSEGTEVFRQERVRPGNGGGGGDGRGRGWPVEDLVSHSKALTLKAPQKFHMCSAPFVCELLATTWDFSINLQYTLYGSASIYIILAPNSAEEV